MQCFKQSFRWYALKFHVLSHYAVWERKGSGPLTFTDCVEVAVCVCRWVRGAWIARADARLISVGPCTTWVHFPAPPRCRFPLSYRPSLLNTGRLISSDWQPCSHLALQSWCPRVSASHKAIVEVPLWLSLSFSQYPAPADRGWKVPTAALNYELHSAPAIYIQPSTGSHFLLKCLLLQITEVIFPALQLEWLWSAGNLPDAAFAYELTTGMKDEAPARRGIALYITRWLNRWGDF